MQKLLGGANGNLKCGCGGLRYAGVQQCPKCFYGEDFDPLANAQALMIA